MSILPRPLKIAYFGSPEFSAHVLDRLIREQSHDPSRYEIACVITQPDKPAGRGLTTRLTPVKSVGQSNHIPVHNSLLINSTLEIQQLFADMHIDLALVYAFNEFIPSVLMKKTLHGFWNIHPSLLPCYRGPSPVVFPIILGDKETGVSLVQMTEKMDAGPILGQKKVSIDTKDTHASLINLLGSLGLELFLNNIAVLQGNLDKTKPSIIQTEAEATYTLKLTRDNGYIPLEKLREVMGGKRIDSSCVSIFKRYYEKNTFVPHINIDMQVLYNLWRGLDPWPGVWTKVQTPQGIRRLKIIKMSEKEGAHLIEVVQLEGKLPVDLATFIQGYPTAFS